jgi:phosphate transport system substrate-binding protein
MVQLRGCDLQVNYGSARTPPAFSGTCRLAPLMLRRTRRFGLRTFSLPPLAVVLGTLLSLGAVWGCGQGPRGQPHSMCVAGSTSVQPFAEKLAEIYMKEHPGAIINVQGGGSSAGVVAARQGVADLGASSRELVAAEKDLGEIAIAWDGIAVVVHPSNPFANIQLEDLRRVFQGLITDWGEMGLSPHPIDIITREEGSGTREAFEHMVMGTAEITPGALVQDSNGAVREIVAHDPYAVGYISVGLVDHRVKAVAIDGVFPSRENIKNHAYKLVRRFLLVSRTRPTGLCQAFIDFILSPQGQHLLEAEGLVGVQ